jgi:hypothetical protein
MLLPGVEAAIKQAQVFVRKVVKNPKIRAKVSESD